MLINVSFVFQSKYLINFGCVVDMNDLKTFQRNIVIERRGNVANNK